MISETILPLCERLQDLESWATRFPEFFARQLERVRLSFSPGRSPEYESIGGRGRSNALGDNYDNIKVCLRTGTRHFLFSRRTTLFAAESVGALTRGFNTVAEELHSFYKKTNRKFIELNQVV